jgi:hypothetical protein
MKTRALIPPFFLDCVVAIGVLVTGAQGVPKTKWTASGFLYGDFVKKVDEKSSEYGVYLVTNRHVLDNKQLVFLRFNPREDKPAQEIPVS